MEHLDLKESFLCSTKNGKLNWSHTLESATKEIILLNILRVQTRILKMLILLLLQIYYGH